MEKIVELKPKSKKNKLIDTLVYEVLEGENIYFKDYKKVLSKKQTLEDIMGSGRLQWQIISRILRFLYKSLDVEKYEIAGAEAGLHLSANNNLALDISIYEMEKLKHEPIQNKYTEVIPLVVIEVDSKAEFDAMQSPNNYYIRKTHKLIEASVQKVIWIMTETKQIIIAEPEKDWIIKDWNKEITVLDGIVFSLPDLFKGSELDWNSINLI